MKDEALIDFGDHVELTVKFITPGIVLACPVFDMNDEIIQPSYTPFTEDFLKSLTRRGIDKVYYTKKTKNPQSENIKDVKKYVGKKIYQGPRSISNETQMRALNIIDQIEDAVRNKLPFTFINDLKDLIKTLKYEIKQMDAGIINLLDVPDFHDYKYSHLLNVATICISFGHILDLEEEDISDLGLASFLHDIGQFKIPYHYFNKQGELTEEEFNYIKQHPRYGYDMIKDIADLSDNVKNAVLCHHEKNDGTGYPLGITGDKMQVTAQILAIAEVFDALTSELSYKQSFPFKKAFNLLLRESAISFHPALIHRFVKEMGHLFKESSYYPIGSFVQLNTKEIALVVDKESDLTSKPLIRIIKNSSGQNTIRSITVDLRRDSERYITKIMNIPI